LTEALWIGERARKFVMGFSRKQNGETCSAVFSGKAIDGSPRRNAGSSQTHAHFLCESSGPSNRGRITHLTIFADDEFSPADVRALSRFDRMRGNGGHDLQLVLLGLGSRGDFGVREGFCSTDEAAGRSPVLGKSRVWVSRTPFVPADRLRRRYQLSDPLEQHRCQLDLARMVRAELARRPWLTEHAAALEDVEAIFGREAGTNLGGTHTSWLKFRRERQRGGGRRGDSHGYGLRLTFREPVQGPIVFGYGCHFGLGQFIPAECSQ
jgi:CRISPR-associated protein Csb2